ncbi:MAG: iron ABC transporter permease [Deltaproteobacteria bacterium]|nr:iron ABC transporter permease [Deltaproteobacteria bacterium]
MSDSLTLARLARVLAGLALLLFFALALGVAVGPSGLALGEVLAALRGGADDVARDIVVRVRLPRVLLAAGVGASLATAGAAFQALLRNPLADPFILGVSGGAALGSIVVISLGAALGVAASAAPVAAFAGAVATVLSLLATAGPRGRLDPTRLLLIGVVFNALASAAIVFLASIAGLAEGSKIFLYLIGNLSDARPALAGWIAAFLALGLAGALPFARALNALALGDDTAALLGFEPARVKLALLLTTSLLVGAAVAVAGLVGFVGLIVPHALRLLFGADHRLLLPASALGGAAFLVACDALARTALGGPELPVGAITALVGGPLFLVLLRKRAGLSS